MNRNLAYDWLEMPPALGSAQPAPTILTEADAVDKFRGSWQEKLTLLVTHLSLPIMLLHDREAKSELCYDTITYDFIHTYIHVYIYIYIY